MKFPQEIPCLGLCDGSQRFLPSSSNIHGLHVVTFNDTSKGSGYLGQCKRKNSNFSILLQLVAAPLLDTSGFCIRHGPSSVNLALTFSWHLPKILTGHGWVRSFAIICLPQSCLSILITTRNMLEVVQNHHAQIPSLKKINGFYFLVLSASNSLFMER